eukprot:scaffold3680_cov381-Prasinococcus_capsulatus_cf.AAC.6
MQQDCGRRGVLALTSLTGGRGTEPVPRNIHKVQHLPRLPIDPERVSCSGHSSGGDFAVQMHIAFSKTIKSACGFDAQPFRCAITRFPSDYLLPQTNSSSVPVCDGCPRGATLVYDHCKNHAEWVVRKLALDDT